jgi:hypothetical protein
MTTRTVPGLSVLINALTSFLETDEIAEAVHRLGAVLAEEKVSA